MRRLLASGGFTLVDERFSYDSGKYYATVVAEYTAEPWEISDADAELGFDIPHTLDRVEYLGYLEGKKKAALKAHGGKIKGGLSTESDEEMLRLIEERISRLVG